MSQPVLSYDNKSAVPYQLSPDRKNKYLETDHKTVVKCKNSHSEKYCLFRYETSEGVGKCIFSLFNRNLLQKTETKNISNISIDRCRILLV